MARRILPALAIAAVSLPLAAAELDQHGNAHAWSGELGRYTVIDFAASWCAPCWRTLPKLQEMAGRHPELNVLVVSVDDQESGRDRLVRELALELPVLWDQDYAIAETYRPTAMPSTVVLDPAGKEIYRQTGSDEKEWRAFEIFLERLLSVTDPGRAGPPTGP